MSKNSMAISKLNKFTLLSLISGRRVLLKEHHMPK